MSKKRIYKYAKEKNVSNKEVINYLQELNFNIKSHMSTVTDETIAELDKKFAPEHSQVQTQSDQTQKQKSQPKQSSEKLSQKKTQGQNSNKHKSDKQKKTKNHKQGKKQQSGPSNNEKQKSSKGTPSKITYSETLTVSDLAEKLNKDASEIIKKLMFLGVMANKNQDIDDDTVELICGEFGVEVEKETVYEDTDFDKYYEADDPEDLVERPAVVTIMGHVDHGKTTLLDSIRHAKVTDDEAGGITQHIGAYQVENDGKKITFLDTPGHSAFTSMRSRGTQITDVAVLVVAADDGVMPQTREAINHAKAAEIPIIVAVNKMDKPGVNPERIKQELTEFELVPEDWGGQTIFVNLSAFKGEGIDELLEMIVLVSEVEELQANPDANASGSVIEAKLEKGRGSVATLLIQNGTLHVGDTIVVGNTFGRVRAMVNDEGKRVKSAGPSMPVEVTGLNNVPQAGDPFLKFTDEKKAKQVGEARQQKQIQESRTETAKLSVDDLFEQIKEDEIKEINVIIKADVQGSAEALASSLEDIDVEGVKIKIIHSGVGAIKESDIVLASASNAIVIGFNVRPDANAKKTAENEKVDIRLHRVIYKAIEEIESAMKGMLDPEYEEKVIGQAEVRDTFKVSKIGTIAGSYVTDGKITRNSNIRVIRDGVVQFDGEIDNLKRYKDDAKEVVQNYECGITIKNFNDIKIGDTLEAYVMEEVERT